jgi:hypothetical protein
MRTEKQDSINTLKAIFWDYPQFTDRVQLVAFLKNTPSEKVRRWILSRFLEHGRVVDTLNYFNLDEIKTNLSILKITPYARNKWQRLIEIYGRAEGE